MAYSVNNGLDNNGLDNTQRGLLIGLPAIALMLSFGAVHHGTNSPVKQTAKTIPVVSSLNGGSNPANTSNKSSGSSAGGKNAATSGNSSVSTSSGSSGYTATSGSSGGATTGSGSSGSGGTGVVGGMGGGPTGGGGTTLPDCSIDQIATVNCRVPACSPEVTLNPGQKAILGLGGTCVVLN